MNFIKKIFKRSKIIPIVRLDGVIGSSGQFSSGLEDSSLAPVLKKAFGMSKAQAIALIINSPGGSPAQSSLIASRIRRLAQEKNLPVFAFCEDVAASGGYWLACAADEIFADENSIIGSIGVISASFGFHELMSKQGIERRIYTAGDEKSMLDPFRPEQKEDIVRLKIIQKAIHDNFRRHVEKRRGEKIKGENIFTGEVWDSFRAKDLGLIDGIGHLEPVLTERYGEEIEFKHVSKKKPLFARLSKSTIDSIFEVFVNKAYFSRFNL
jgi:serine protease SohB